MHCFTRYVFFKVGQAKLSLITALEPPSSPLGNITPPSSPPPNPVGCGQAQTQSDSRPPPRPKLQVDLEEIERWPLWKKECFERLLWYSYSDIMLSKTPTLSSTYIQSSYPPFTDTMGNLATANSIMLQIRPRALLTPRELEPIEEFLPDCMPWGYSHNSHLTTRMPCPRKLSSTCRERIHTVIGSCELGFATI